VITVNRVGQDSSKESEEQVLETVAGFLREVIGEEWARDVPIGMNTSFNEDLELESIEFVALAEKLQARYGDQVDFVGWLSQKELDEIIGLTVGDVVELVVECH
jgi:acyl carrier protein